MPPHPCLGQGNAVQNQDRIFCPSAIFQNYFPLCFCNIGLGAWDNFHLRFGIRILFVFGFLSFFQAEMDGASLLRQTRSVSPHPSPQLTFPICYMCFKAVKGPTPKWKFQNGSSKKEVPNKKFLYKKLPISKLELPLSANGQ